MAEVAVAFPNDETTAEVIASRLRADGIAARVDRGLHGSWQVPARGQLTVLVDERVAERAQKVLGTERREASAPSLFARLAVAVLVVALVVGVAAIGVTLATR